MILHKESQLKLFHTVLRFIGWLVILLFWVVFFSAALGILRGGEGSAVTGIGSLIQKTFPVIFAPVFILIYGMRTSKRSLWKKIYLWVSIALITYIALVFVASEIHPYR